MPCKKPIIIKDLNSKTNDLTRMFANLRKKTGKQPYLKGKGSGKVKIMFGDD